MAQSRIASRFLRYSHAPILVIIPAMCRVSIAALLVLAATQTATAQQIGVCADSDGDGWGWNGVASCLVEADNEAATELVKADCVDSDGDGWGWDGNASCLVESSTASAAVDTTHSDCIDSDGDGWGWDGVSSCRVGTATPSQGPSSAGGGETEGGNSNGHDIPMIGAFDRNRDLVALHYDHAPDPDDGHAAAAGYIVAKELGLNVAVVGGAYGVWNANRYVSSSEGLMYAIWGNEWLDAHNNRSSAVSVAAARWASTLAAGGDVWVAEGGQSDFTAAVVRAIQQQFPEIRTSSRIYLIQHSQWNEDHANASDLSFVKSNTHYMRIEDGNNPNSTADFRSETPDRFVSVARSSRYAGIWNSAFAYLSPYEKLDFSDTVELMHILGIGVGSIATVEQFADRFMR